MHAGRMWQGREKRLRLEAPKLHRAVLTRRGNGLSIGKEAGHGCSLAMAKGHRLVALALLPQITPFPAAQVFWLAQRWDMFAHQLAGVSQVARFQRLKRQ